MRVDPSGNSIKITQPAPNSAPQAGKAAPAGVPAEAGTFSPTSQLSQLLEGVRRAPDVRPDAVQAAAARVASGELSTPDAASETAQAFLAGGDAGAPG